MKLYKRVIFIFFVIGLVLGTLSCSNDLGEEGSTPSGSISGHAYYSNSNDSTGIIVSLEKTDGLHSLSVIESVKTKKITDNSRTLVGTSSLKADGSYIFKNLEDGIYTVYATSANSTEKAVSINNAVIANGKNVTVADLQLTATGSISGKVTLDDSASESYGFLVYIAGTSYSAMTDIDGTFIITNVPAKSNYSLIVQKGNFTYFWKKDITVTSNNETKLSGLQFTSAYINEFISGPNGKDGTSIVWKGSYESANDLISENGNAQYLWAYYNIIDECSYIYNGTEWTLLAGIPSWDKGLYNSFTIDGTECVKTGEIAVIASRAGSKTITGNGTEGVFILGRKVELSPYAIGKYEVTQQLFNAVMGTNPSYCTTDVTGENSLLKPVDCSWYDAIAFCNKLSILNNLDPVYSVEGITDWSSFEFSDIPTSCDIKWESVVIDISKNGFRLPTEAEWEYAARGANPNAEEWNYTYAGSDDASLVAWYESESTTHEVGLKSPNSIGLYDMSGNAYEWCSDLYNTPVETGFVTDPINLVTGNYRVQRGGCFKDPIVPITERRSDACGGGPAAHWNDWGFRICRNLTTRNSNYISQKKIYYIGIDGYKSLMDSYSENSLYTNIYTIVLDVSSSRTFYVEGVSGKLNYVKYDDYSDAYITVAADNSFTVNNKTETKVIVNIYVTKDGNVTVYIKDYVIWNVKSASSSITYEMYDISDSSTNYIKKTEVIVAPDKSETFNVLKNSIEVEYIETDTIHTNFITVAGNSITISNETEFTNYNIIFYITTAGKYTVSISEVGITYISEKNGDLIYMSDCWEDSYDKYKTICCYPGESRIFSVKNGTDTFDYVPYDTASSAFITVNSSNEITITNNTDLNVYRLSFYTTVDKKFTVSVKEESVILRHRSDFTIESPAFEASDKEEYSGMFKCIINPSAASYDYILFGDDYFKYKTNETDFSSQVELNPYNTNGDECVVTNSSATNYLNVTIYFNIVAKTYTIYLKEGDEYTVNVSSGSWYYRDLNIEDNNLDVMIIFNGGVLQTGDLICSPRTGLAYYDCSLTSSKVDVAGSSRTDLPTESFTDGNNLRIYVYCNTTPNLYMWYKNAASVENWPGEAMSKFVVESD